MAFAFASKPNAAKPARAGASIVQAKLKVGTPNDRFEQEADRVADEVLNASEPAPAAQVLSAPPSVQRTCGACAQEDETVRRLPSNAAAPLAGAAVSAPVAQSIHEARDSGSALPADTRQFLEPRFGRDLSSVRIHANSTDGELAKQLQAKAFTVGPDVFFAPGEFQTDSRSGMRVLSHELAHAAQQRMGDQE
jgi:hypothetical protein